jgi:2-oxoglutarate ferredoxin oxidoreductase subunit beta
MSETTSNSLKTVTIKRSKKDFESDQDVRWCPGCGDYAILASVQKVLADLNRNPENTTFISGIGCASRLPYYMNAYGFHTIHGRAPTFATGLKLSRPELDVWIVTGDGDGLSIGLGHLLHIMRRNIDVTILMMNNRIYGLTKGQYSPTSEVDKKTKSSPLGTQDLPLNPVKLALAAECSFVARAIDIDSVNLQHVLKEAANHKGTSFIEIYQNCNVFNDGAFADISQRDLRIEKTIQLQPGKPMIFGKDNTKGIISKNGQLSVVDVTAENLSDILEYCVDETNSYAHQLLQNDSLPVPLGIFKASSRPAWQNKHKISFLDREQLSVVMNSGNTWAHK